MADNRLNGIPVIYVSGTHYEVGFTIGQTFKSMIQAYVANLKELNSIYLPCYEKVEGRQIYEETLAVIQENFPQYIREIQGTADGSGVPFHKLMLLHMDQIVPNNTLNISTRTNGEGCTSILCNGEQGIIGHTEDALPETLNHIYIVNALIRESEPQGKWGFREERYSALCYAGLLPGFCMGWNHHGLIFTINVIFPKRVLSKKTPRHILTRALLAAPNMETAQKILRDSGVGSADGFSVNMTFLLQDGERLFHNAEVGPAYDSNESVLSILTLSPGEYLGHCNKYYRLEIEELDDESSDRRRRVINGRGRLQCERDVINVLSDNSDSVFPIFREGDRTCKDYVATVAVDDFFYRFFPNDAGQLKNKLVDVNSVNICLVMGILDEVLYKRTLLVTSKKKLPWGLLNLLIASFFLHDLWQGYERLTNSWLWYLELVLASVFSMNAILDLYTYMLPLAFMPPTKVSFKQKQLFGVDDKDPGFILATSTPEKKFETSAIMLADQTRCSPSSLAPLTPVDLSAASWASETPNQSYAEESPSWLQNQTQRTSLHASYSRLFSSSYQGDEDERELATILKEMEKQEHKNFLGDISQQQSVSSNAWNYSSSLINMHDYSPLLKKFTYQLSTPPSGHGQSATMGSSDAKGMSPLRGLGNETLKHMGVQQDELLEWTKNIRLWLSETIVKPLCCEIQAINNVLTAHGLEAKIGEAPLDKLRKLSNMPAVGSHVPNLSRILPYLEVSTVQEYVVSRIQDLATGGCLSEYRWNNGGSYNAKPWDETLPTDAALLLHLFCTYMDDRLPQLNDRPDKKPFTGQYFIQLSDRSRACSPQRNVVIMEVSLHPPHFQIIASGGEAFDLPKGRNNLFYALVFFILLIKQRCQGMVGRLSIEQPGLNLAWIINS